MKTVVISGASRGIGLALTEVFLQNGYKVVATARDLKHATALKELATKTDREQLLLEPLDVQSSSSVLEFWGRLENLPSVEYLINNAGLLAEYGAGAGELNLDVVAQTFDVNTLGPMRMVQAGLSHLQNSKRSCIVNVSSKVGSLTDNSSGFGYAYRMSKCALNMFTQNLSIEFPKIVSVAFHPGWVQTDMGGKTAPTSPEESASGMFTVINGLKIKDSGRFLDFRGQALPW
ncbi:SDR family oxidoreductase [Oligoflexaceae bacterium]|nr:SDR family oxidoreductase [Oligoflexaceae bacterium]